MNLFWCMNLMLFRNRHSVRQITRCWSCDFNLFCLCFLSDWFLFYHGNLTSQVCLYAYVDIRSCMNVGSGYALWYYFLCLCSGVLRRSNDTARLLLTTIMGMVLGYFIGVSFPSVYLSKVWSKLLRDLFNEDFCHRLVHYTPFFFLSSAGRLIYLQVLWHLLTWPSLMILIVLVVAVFRKALVPEVLLCHLRSVSCS